MKTIKLLAILLLISNLNIQAQFANDVSDNENLKIKTSRKKNDNDFYLSIGYAHPIGQFGKNATVTNMKSAEESFNNILGGNHSGCGATGGMNITMGKFFNMTKKSDKYLVGINFTYLNMNLMNYSWDGAGDEFVFSGASRNPYFNLGIRIGPELKIKLSEKTAFSVHYQLAPTLSSGPSWTNTRKQDIFPYSDESTRVSIESNASFSAGAGFGLKHNIGVHLALSKFFIGMNLDLGKIKYNNVSYSNTMNIEQNDYNYNSQEYEYANSDRETFSYNGIVKAPNSQFTFSIGLIF